MKRRELFKGTTGLICAIATRNAANDMIIDPYRFAASEFLPTDIGSLHTWLDASERGSTALQWDDKSGNSNHWTSTEEAEFPTFSGGEADFLGAEQLWGPSLAGFSAGEAFCRIKAVTTSGKGWGRFGSSASSNYYTYTDGDIYDGFGSTARKDSITPTMSLTVYRTINVFSAANDWAFLLDAVNQHATSLNTVGFRSDPCLGWGSGSYLNGYIKSFCLFNAKLSSADRLLMETYMSGL